MVVKRILNLSISYYNTVDNDGMTPSSFLTNNSLLISLLSGFFFKKN